MLTFSSNQGNVGELNGEMPFFSGQTDKNIFLIAYRDVEEKGTLQTLLVKVNYSSFFIIKDAQYH